MTINIITLFPEVFRPLLESSILAKAQKEKKLNVRTSPSAQRGREPSSSPLLRVDLINLRDFGIGTHRQVDDRPYGGGVGMILMVEPIYKAVQKAKKRDPKARVILLTPQGKLFNQKTARKLSKESHLILICGHYEGVDERVHQLADEEISIGDYVLTGGEVPAMVVLDSVARLIPEVLDKEATEKESFSLYSPTSKPHPLLEPPQYTRPEIFPVGKRKLTVPKILLSGNHKEIEKWRCEQALEKTKRRRPDLLKDS